MPTRKRILCPQRVRCVPKSFSWVDHRLVRDGHISLCSHEALALYLLLVTVADAEGLSYYSDPAVARLLGMNQATLATARGQLCQLELIVYQSPLYQVLSLEEPTLPLRSNCKRSGNGQAVSIGEVLRRAMGGGQ